MADKNKIPELIDGMWETFDKDGSGALDKNEARLLLNQIMTAMGEEEELS